jgi:hypothetical protein
VNAMQAIRPFVALASLLAFALAGCAGSPSGTLAFNGSGNGTQQDSFQCDGSGEVDFSANLGGGSVTLTIKDSTGKSVYTKRADSAGQTAEEGDVSGASGEWTMTAARTSNGFGPFAGQYAVAIRC